METPFTAVTPRSSKAKTLAIVALAVVGTFAACYLMAQPADVELVDVNPTALYDLYTHWKKAHSLSYGGPEDKMRFNVFSSNYKKILRHNAQNNTTYELGLNKFAALTREEFSNMYLGYNAHDKPALHERVFVEDSVQDIPKSIDWTQKGAVTPVKDQGQCGSCWAFSTTGSLEGLAFQKNGKLTSFSEQQLVDCSGSFGNQGCNGGLMDYAFKYVAANGIVSEDKYPYMAADGKCKIPSCDKFKNSKYVDVKTNDPDALKAAIAKQPVSVAIEADQEAFQLYKGGVITGNACGTQLDHGVLAVGYDTTDKQPYYKVKNSWGATWGEEGYVRIGIAKGAGVCGIQKAASYPTA